MSEHGKGNGGRSREDERAAVPRGDNDPSSWRPPASLSQLVTGLIRGSDWSYGKRASLGSRYKSKLIEISLVNADRQKKKSHN